MLKKGRNEILKHNFRNNISIKYNYKNIILKSIIQNQNISNKQRVLAKFFLKKSNNKVQKKTCFVSGLHKGINTKLNMSRHNLNYFSKLGILQNFKIRSW